MSFKEIKPDEFNVNPFSMIGKDWMLITSESNGKTNAMTASWGGLGVLWGMNTAFIFVRQSRFTKTLIDASENFSLSFFDTEKYRSMLGYMGSASGRDENKIGTAGLTLCHDNGVPFFEEASTVILCKKLSRHFLTDSGFLSGEIGKYYPDGDYHDLYVGEITKILRAD